MGPGQVLPRARIWGRSAPLGARSGPVAFANLAVLVENAAPTADLVDFLLQAGLYRWDGLVNDLRRVS